MDELDRVRMRLKNKKHTINRSDIGNDYVNKLITRILLSVIIFLGTIIVMNLNSDAESFIKNDVLKNNMSFSKIMSLYNKYFGKVIPIKEVKDTTVFNESIKYKELTNYKDGYLLKEDNNYLVPVINSGIVVFIGEKEGYGNTVIIQGIDEIDYWYGNIDNLNVSLYDYVNKKTILGSTKDTNLYLVFQKDGEYLGYDEVME